MSYFNACAFVEKNGLSTDEMTKKLETLLSTFDVGKKVPPYKRRVAGEELGDIASHFKIDPTDHQAVAAQLKKWNGDTGGVDEQGVYAMSTKNPTGYIDGWSAETELAPHERTEFLLGPRMIVRAIITPDGTWISGPWVYGRPTTEQKKQLDAWEKTVMSMLQKYPDTSTFLVRCHI